MISLDAIQIRKFYEGQSGNPIYVMMRTENWWNTRAIW